MMISFSSASRRPCRKPKAQPAQVRGAQVLIHLGRRFQCRFLERGSVGFLLRFSRWRFLAGFAVLFGIRRGEVELGLVVLWSFDDWIDDVRLMATLDLVAKKLPYVFGALVGNLFGDDGCAARRKLVEYAEVEVSIKRQGKGARDGCCSHDQNIRLGGIWFLHEAETLQNAEAVLLVDDDHAQVGKVDFFFDQSVRSDDEIGFAMEDAAAGELLLVFVERAGEQDDAIAARRFFEQLARGEVMLRGEDLGRGHERGLTAIFYDDEHGLQRHDSFAGADISLKQTAHGRWLAHVGDDFAERALLRRGGMKGQDLADRFADLIVGLKGEAGALLHSCGV